MVDVDCNVEGKSEKTLKTEELEVLVRLLNSNLEGLRYLQRESSTRDDVALNNRLLTARISALSGLITFVSEGEIAQIRGSDFFPQTVNYAGHRSTLADDNDEEEDQGEEEEEEEEADNVDDDNNNDNEEDNNNDDNDNVDFEESDTAPLPKPEFRSHIFQSIRPMMEVLRRGIVLADPTTAPSPSTSHEGHTSSYSHFHSHPKSPSPSPPTPTPPPPPPPPPEKTRSEYETGDISSIDQKRRPVIGIPAPPARRVPSGAIPGGGGPVRGNLNDIRRSRRPVFLEPSLSTSSTSGESGSEVPIAGTASGPSATASVYSLLSDDGGGGGGNRHNPRKRRLEMLTDGVIDEGEGEEEGEEPENRAEEEEEEEDFRDSDGGMLPVAVAGYTRKRKRRCLDMDAPDHDVIVVDALDTDADGNDDVALPIDNDTPSPAPSSTTAPPPPPRRARRRPTPSASSRASGSPQALALALALALPNANPPSTSTSTSTSTSIVTTPTPKDYIIEFSSLPPYAPIWASDYFSGRRVPVPGLGPGPGSEGSGSGVGTGTMSGSSSSASASSTASVGVGVGGSRGRLHSNPPSTSMGTSTSMDMDMTEYPISFSFSLGPPYASGPYDESDIYSGRRIPHHEPSGLSGTISRRPSASASASPPGLLHSNSPSTSTTEHPLSFSLRPLIDESDIYSGRRFPDNEPSGSGTVSGRPSPSASEHPGSGPTPTNANTVWIHWTPPETPDDERDYYSGVRRPSGTSPDDQFCLEENEGEGEGGDEGDEEGEGEGNEEYEDDDAEYEDQDQDQDQDDGTPPNRRPVSIDITAPAAAPPPLQIRFIDSRR